MSLKTALPFLAALALFSLDSAGWADGERGTPAEAASYEAREADDSSLEEFSGGFGGLLHAIVAFFSNAIQAIVDLIGGGNDDVFTPPPAEQGRGRPEGLPAPA
jgi:hypothetical protein